MNSKCLHIGIVCLFLFCPFISQAQTTDNSKVVKSPAVKTHLVAQGETLMGIARKNHCTVEQITQLNPSLTSKTLKYGSKINVPVYINIPPNNTGSPMVKTLTGTSVSTEVKGASGFSPVYHVVQKGETLSAIAAQYHQNISSLKQWNHLAGSNLIMGKKLIVGETTATISPKITTPSSDLIENTTKGIAEWQTGTSAAATGNFLFGLCSTVPQGSIVKITNPVNNESILVKIIGRLTPVDENVLIEIPETAARQLNADEEKFAVRLSYFLPSTLSLK